MSFGQHAKPRQGIHVEASSRSLFFLSTLTLVERLPKSSMTSGRVFLAALVVSLMCGCLAGESDVVVFTDNDMDSQLALHDTALVMFYAPWCGHCKRLKPEFEQAAVMLKSHDPPITLAKVDCTDAGKDTCGKYGVTGYPTLKIFRSGEVSQEYNGPREAAGIVKYMKAQVGPSSKELKSAQCVEDFTGKDDVGVVGFFKDAASSLKAAFTKAADKLRETIRFAHTTSQEAMDKYEFSDKIVLFRPKRLHSKFEPSSVTYEGEENKEAIEKWIKKNYHGLVGVRERDSAQDFTEPLVVVYYNVDYVKNPKGTNYWRNRVLKVAQNFADTFNFAISAKDDFQHELNDYGIDYTPGDKPIACAKNAKSQKFIMKDDFSVETFQKFLQDLKEEKLEAYLKSEPIPEDNSGPVTIAVANNFDDVVTNNDKDTLVEFYAPWCGHCKKLAPVFDELGDKLKNEQVAIVKMDATANDVSHPYDVKGFPTLYWIPKDNKSSPRRYEGGRELNDFIQYIAKHATDELNGWDRSGNPKKKEEL